MNRQRFTKDSDSVLDYQIDWSTWLDTDTIVTSTWTVDSGITKDSNSNTTTTATIWLSGGTVGTHACTNHIVTAGGREDDRTIYVVVYER